jgi:hypothetical protein
VTAATTGHKVHFIEAKVYRGVEHQDGRTVLALRRFLKAVYAAHPLRNVTLIGDFPESSIVRRVFVRSHVDAEGKMIGGVNYANTDFADTGTELVAPRSDLVLSDCTAITRSVSATIATSRIARRQCVRASPA